MKWRQFVTIVFFLGLGSNAVAQTWDGFTRPRPNVPAKAAREATRLCQEHDVASEARALCLAKTIVGIDQANIDAREQIIVDIEWIIENLRDLVALKDLRERLGRSGGLTSRELEQLEEKLAARIAVLEGRVTKVEERMKHMPDIHLVAGLDGFVSSQGAVGMVEGSVLLVWNGDPVDIRVRGGLLLGWELRDAERMQEGGPVHGGRLELGLGSDFTEHVGGHIFVGGHVIDGNGPAFLDLGDLDWQSAQVEFGARLWLWRLELFGAVGIGPDAERGRTPRVKIGPSGIFGLAMHWL